VDERKVRLWDTVRRSYLGIELPSDAHMVVWSPDGRWFAAGHLKNEPGADVTAVSFINIGTGAVTKRPLTGLGFTPYKLLAWTTAGDAVLFGVGSRPGAVFARVGRDGSHSLITTNWRPKGDNFGGSISQLGRPAELVVEYGKPSRAGTRDLETGQVGEVYPAPIPPMGPFCDFIAETWCGRVDGQRVLLEDLRTGRSKPVLTLSGQLMFVHFGPRIAGSKTPSFPLR